MRNRDLIDDATFSRERDTLQKELTKTQQGLNETHDRAAQWLELTERAFHFATNAYTIFKAVDLKTKWEIFNAIGSSYVLKSMGSILQQRKWIVPISNELESKKIDIGRLELLKNASIDEKTPAFAEVHSRWGAVVEKARTVFTRRNDATIYIPCLQNSFNTPIHTDAFKEGPVADPQRVGKEINRLRCTIGSRFASDR
jgi:hypothetical protein